MMSIWHLLWIVPSATMFGYCLAGLMVANKFGKQLDKTNIANHLDR